MGYTHYFTMADKPATDGVWEKFCELTKQIIESSKVSICDGMGEGVPLITSEEIMFNGDASNDEAFETMHIRKEIPTEWNFCKTGRRPYDEVVVAVLFAATKLKILTWSSDGENQLGDFDDAKKLLDSLK